MENKLRDNLNYCNQELINKNEEIVISGIAGRFPDSDNIKQLQNNLFNKVNLVTTDNRRWNTQHPDIPPGTGKINNINKFDATFFDINFKQAHTMDPSSRMLLEHTYEAIIDAGINPQHLRGTRTGVFIGSCVVESDINMIHKKNQAEGLGISGCAKNMLANRISYYFNLTGPSYTIDTACSSTLYAVEQAYRAISNGECDSALVGGANLCLHPNMSRLHYRLGILSSDHACKCFDNDANGYARSEAACIMLLQKYKQAKRIYATVIHGKTNCDGFKEQGITFPSVESQIYLLNEFYKECKIPTNSIEYIEAHGTGTQVGDPEELNAIDSVFSHGRDKPLMIGSIKSNLGHTEPASGMCSIAKIIIANETGVIPPNIHYKNPRHGVDALMNRRIKVVTEPTPWSGGYVGVNSFGFGGANAHILLKSNSKDKINDGDGSNDDLPRLVAVSGRTEEAVNNILRDIENRQLDVEYVKLLHDIHADNIPGHSYRGYTILQNNISCKKLIRKINYYDNTKRPIWFIFSDIISQSSDINTALLRLPVFAKAIEKCNNVLKSLGIDIYDILTNNNKLKFNNTLYSFVKIAAIQIGLVDLLASVNIIPDHIIGYSIGELGCAYADGCFTAEQIILAAYFRDFTLIEANTKYNSMAIIELDYKYVKELCPSDIKVLYNNNPGSSIISGPAKSMKEFIANLRLKNIFIHDISYNNIEYHSRFIDNAGPKYFEYLRDIIPGDKIRSKKWISTSLSQNEWMTIDSYKNNILNADFIDETLNIIPDNAVTIEIGSSKYINSIIDNSGKNISLTQCDYDNDIGYFLQSIGELYNIGLQPLISKLYPDVKFPVSRGTPMISPLIKWDHSDDWYVCKYELQDKIDSGVRSVDVCLTDEEYECMAGHVIDGRNLLPATQYLALVWETLGMMLGELYTGLSVVFRDIKFIRATTMTKDGIVTFSVMIQKGTGRFEVGECGAAVVTGFIHYLKNPLDDNMNLLLCDNHDEIDEISGRDFYKELTLRGYQYDGLFKGIKSSRINGCCGKIIWNNNWIGFIENMIQLKIFGLNSRGLFVPSGIQKLVIDVDVHSNEINSMADEKELSVNNIKACDLIIAGGVEIQGVKLSRITRRKINRQPVLEIYKFVAHRDGAKMLMKEAVYLATHLAIENQVTMKGTTLEIVEDDEMSIDNLISPFILEIINNFPVFQADVNILGDKNAFKPGDLSENINFIKSKKPPADMNAFLLSGRNILTQKNPYETISQLLFALKDDGFVLTIESGDYNDLIKSVKNHRLNIIMEKHVGNSTLLLLRKENKLSNDYKIVKVNNNKFVWLDDLKSLLKSQMERESSSKKRIIIIGEKQYENGVLGLVNCLRKEPGGEMIRGFLIQDKKAPYFTKSNKFYASQLNLDLALNVLRSNGKWGSYRYLPRPATIPRLCYHAWANQSVRNDLNSIQWLEGPIKPDYSNPDIVRIVYSAINFGDVMLATGKLTPDVVIKSKDHEEECGLGFEFSGIDKSGNRVMGIISSRALANHTVLDRDLTWYVPNNWTLEDAATVPCAYATSYYALYINGKMKKCDKVLIHAGSGGVGQAAIEIALNNGCEVFTTVGTAEKREFIKRKFPQIHDNHIGNSRDTSFEQLIIKETDGRGVDIILNSLAVEKLQASIRCLAAGGRFLEIGKFDMANDSKLDMMNFNKGISFHSILLDNIFDADVERKLALKEIIQKGLNDGSIKPLTRTVFMKNRLVEAFRYMGSGKHIGKVIIKILDENNPDDVTIPGLSRYYCLPNRSYVIIGGLGGFGLELVNWLIQRGGRNFVLTSRTGIKNGYQQMRVTLWRSYGVRVIIITGKNSTNHKDCEDILKAATDLHPIDAIFNVAVVIKDGLLQNQTSCQFEETFEPKARCTKILDELSRKVCPELRHFVVFSSLSSGQGTAGQTNYGMSNAIMDLICEKRVAEGFPALAIQWGPIGDVGLLTEIDNDKEIIIGGKLQQNISSCLHELNGFLMQDSTIVSTMIVADKIVDINTRNIVEIVRNIMNIKDLNGISHQISLPELGMDSIMSVEIGQMLKQEFELSFTPQDIRALNFAKLLEISNNIQDNKNTIN